MLSEKETETQIPDMLQIEDVDDAIKILFGVPLGRKEIIVYENEENGDERETG